MKILNNSRLTMKCKHNYIPMYEVEEQLFNFPTNSIYHQYCPKCNNVQFMYTLSDPNEFTKKKYNVNVWMDIEKQDLKERLLKIETQKECSIIT